MNGKIAKLKIKNNSPLRIINKLPNIEKKSSINDYLFKKKFEISNNKINKSLALDSFSESTNNLKLKLRNKNKSFIFHNHSKNFISSGVSELKINKSINGLISPYSKYSFQDSRNALNKSNKKSPNPKKNKSIFQKIIENIEKIKKSNQKAYEIIKRNEKKTIRLQLRNFYNWQNIKIKAKNKTTKNKEEMDTKSRISRLRRNETTNKISKIIDEEKKNIENETNDNIILIMRKDTNPLNYINKDDKQQEDKEKEDKEKEDKEKEEEKEVKNEKENKEKEDKEEKQEKQEKENKEEKREKENNEEKENKDESKKNLENNEDNEEKEKNENKNIEENKDDKENNEDKEKKENIKNKDEKENKENKSKKIRTKMFHIRQISISKKQLRSSFYKAGIINKIWRKTFIKGSEMQFNDIFNQANLILNNIDFFKVNYFNNKKFFMAFKKIDNFKKAEFNSTLEELCFLLIEIVPKLIQKFYGSLDRILYVKIPDLEEEQEKIPRNERECLDFNCIYLNQVSNYFMACIEVLKEIKKRIDYYKFNDKEYLIIDNFLNLSRVDISKINSMAESYIEKMKDDEKIWKKMEVNLGIRKNKKVLGENMFERSHRKYQEKLKEEMKLERINSTLNLRSTFFDEKRNKFILKRRLKNLNILNQPIISSLMKYINSNIKSQIISQQVMERYQLKERLEKQQKKVITKNDG